MSKQATLTAKQERYCIERAMGKTQALAYQAAFNSKCNLRNAENEASRLESRSKIKVRINKIRDQTALKVIDKVSDTASEKVATELDRWNRELRRISFFDPSLLFDDKGNILPASKWSDDVRASIAGFEIEEVFSGHGDNRQISSRIIKIRFWNKIHALEILGRALKEFSDETTINENLLIVNVGPDGMKPGEWENFYRPHYKQAPEKSIKDVKAR